MGAASVHEHCQETESIVRVDAQMERVLRPCMNTAKRLRGEYYKWAITICFLARFNPLVGRCQAGLCAIFFLFRSETCDLARNVPTVSVPWVSRESWKQFTGLTASGLKSLFEHCVWRALIVSLTVPAVPAGTTSSVVTACDRDSFLCCCCLG